MLRTEWLATTTMGGRGKPARILCINCNICVNTLRRYRALELDIRVTTLLCNWVHPQIITEDDYVCEACRDLAMVRVNDNLQQEVAGNVGQQAGPSHRGHTNVCLLCGRSTAIRRSYRLLRDNLSELQQSIFNILQSRIPRQITVSDRVCHACWVRTQREALQIRLSHRSLPTPAEEMQEGQMSGSISSVKTNVLVGTNCPVETNRPIDTNPPVETNSPIDTNTPVETNRPIDTNPSVDKNRPIDTNPPVETYHPIDTNPPVETDRPIDMNPSVDKNRLNDTNPPVETNLPIDTNPPVETNRPIDTNPLVDTNCPVGTNQPVEINPLVNTNYPGDTIRSVTNRPVESNRSVDVQRIVLPNYRRAANTTAHCVFPNCHSVTLHCISDKLRAIVLSNHNYYLPNQARLCTEHLMSNSWETLFDSENSMKTFTTDQIQHVFSFVNAFNPTLDFENVQEMDDRIFEYWIGLTKKKFNTLLRKVPRIREIRRGSLGLATLLLKMKTGDSDDRISTLVQVPRRTLESLMDKVKAVLVQDFVSENLEISNLRREELLQQNLAIPTPLYGNGDNVVVICNGT